MTGDNDPVRWLRAELATWRDEGLVTAEQARAIAARYDEPRPSVTRDRVVVVISTLGAVVTGLGVILLVAANWEGMQPLVRLVLLTSAMVGLYAAAWLVHTRTGRHLVSSLLALVGTFVFGASLFLLGQTYHVRAHDPTAFGVLALAAAGMAVVLRSRPHAMLAAASVVAWWMHEVIVAADDAGSDSAIAAGGAAVALAGLALLAIGDLAARRPDGRLAGNDSTGALLGRPARATGFLLAAAALVVPLSFAHRLYDDAGADAASPRLVVLAVVAACVAAGSAIASFVLRRSQIGRRVAAGVILLAAAVVASWQLAPGADASIIANGAIVAAAVGAIALGIATREKLAYALGIALLVVEVAVRYVDTLFDILPGGLFFVGAGLALVLVGVLISRGRRLWLRPKGSR